MEWKKNLYDYEATPPGEAWANISREIESDVPAVRDALYDYAEEPPAFIWQAVVDQLDQPKISPLYQYRRPLAYAAAAAAMISGVIFFSNYFNSDKQGSSTPEISASVYKPVQPTEPVAPAPENNGTTTSETEYKIGTKEKDQATEKQIADNRPEETKRPIASIQPVRFDPDDENYIYLTSSNGEIKRISYKFEEMIPEMKKQNSELIQKWKQKLEASSFIPAGNNFFDIAEMVKILQEEKRP